MGRYAVDVGSHGVSFDDGPVRLDVHRWLFSPPCIHQICACTLCL